MPSRRSPRRAKGCRCSSARPSGSSLTAELSAEGGGRRGRRRVPLRRRRSRRAACGLSRRDFDPGTGCRRPRSPRRRGIPHRREGAARRPGASRALARDPRGARSAACRRSPRIAPCSIGRTRPKRCAGPSRPRRGRTARAAAAASDVEAARHGVGRWWRRFRRRRRRPRTRRRRAHGRPRAVDSGRPAGARARRRAESASPKTKPPRANSNRIWPAWTRAARRSPRPSRRSTRSSFRPGCSPTASKARKNG